MHVPKISGRGPLLSLAFVAALGSAGVQAQQYGLLAQQARGRKEHLTGMFLARGYKMADIQK